MSNFAMNLAETAAVFATVGRLCDRANPAPGSGSSPPSGSTAVAFLLTETAER
jgi:hypothetical protein